MTLLNASTMESLGARAQLPRYDRRAVSTGIVHIGVGGFHRAHHAMYVDRLMNAGEMDCDQARAILDFLAEVNRVLALVDFTPEASQSQVTAIIDASGRLNPKALLGSDYGPGTMLEMIPREADSPDPVPERARMLKGCEIYINGAPCPMCMSAIYWSRIDHVYFGASLEDTSKIGFDDAFQYADFKLPWEKRRIAVTPGFEREAALAAFQAWEDKKDRHPY